MSKFIAPRSAQYPLFVTLLLNATDTVGVGAAATTIGAGGSFPMALPPGARVVFGEAFVDTPFSGAGVSAAAITVGDAALATRYAPSFSVFASADEAVVVPNFANGTGENVVVALAVTGGVATAGKVAVVIGYVVDGRSNENQIT
jgi:hypothetical protein